MSSVAIHLIHGHRTQKVTNYFHINRADEHFGTDKLGAQMDVQMIKRFTSYLVCAVAASAGLFLSPARAGSLDECFQNPPEAARPWVFWYWMQGAVSREGVTADLEAMKQAGIGGAYLMPIKDVTNPPLFEPPVRQLSSEWWAMLRFAFSEADRLGLKFAMHDCDGFATAGGPWITPELAMQKVVWSETQIAGGKFIQTNLPQPPTNESFYRDIAVLAFPTLPGEGVTTRTVAPRVTTSVAGVDAQGIVDGSKRFRSDGPCWIQYEFAGPFTCRSITIRPDGNNYQALRLMLEASDDGKNFHSLGRLETPRHGWQDSDADYTFVIVPTTARFFRFVYDPAGSEPGAEDLDSAKWKPVLKVQGIELSSALRIPNYEGKSGVVWRKSSRATAELIPDNLCVPLNRITNLTSRVNAAGKLVWDAPPGRWTILRIGHTPTGHRNETGGGGKGLECDKFNPAAARVQFDGWFGETIRQVGPKLAGRVLKVFHVDSWEAGSQNWSPVFHNEFVKRRGYDPTLYLPAFAGIPVGSAEISERFLFDVRQTIADLTAKNFFGMMAKLAHKHGCEFSAESVAPTMMSDGMRHFGNVDVPMGEFWLRSPTHDKPNDMADAISGAHVYGKNIVQAEAFTELRLQWDEQPAMLKALGDHNFCLGINRFVLHVFMHNPWMNRLPGMTLGGVGTFFQRDQTWWDLAGGWIDYLGRCQTLLQQGRPVADVLYFTGEELPSRAILPERRMPPLPAGYTADSINRDALLRLASVKDGRIVLPGGASYAILVLPDTPLMTPELAAKIQKLVKQGATVYGPPPQRSLSLENFPACDEKVRKIATEAWGRNVGVVWGVPLDVALQRARLAPDCLVEAEARKPVNGIEWTHRSAPDAEIYFISNQREEEQAIQVSLRATGRRPELWNPVTSKTTAVSNFSENDGRTTLPLHLASRGSVFVVLRKAAKNQPQPVGGKNWIEPRPALDIAGAWQVTFDPVMSGLERPVRFPQLASWITRDEPEIHFYSGSAIYSKTFNWDKSVQAGRFWLDLGGVSDIASVTLNGKDCGTAWTSPFRVEITSALRRGANTLEIRVANTWNNRLVGDRGVSPSKRKTWTNAPDRSENNPLLRAGLLGPVTVLIGD
jgi:hypothetical protein